ncbi:MAG: hypothetical protein JSS83_09100 [Cyanobacteria bacterium SZAS LIN-3]|nr:hypothetical protein [Cyanobacteria bacterium SZAS LIN-3]
MNAPRRQAFVMTISCLLAALMPQTWSPLTQPASAQENCGPKPVTVCDVFMWDNQLVAKYADVFYRLDTAKGTSQKMDLPLFPVILALGRWEDRPLAMGKEGDRFKVFDRRGDKWHELILPQRAHAMGDKVRLCAYKKAFVIVGENSAFRREDNSWQEINYHRMPDGLYDKVKNCQARHYYALTDDVIWRAYGNSEKGGLCKISLSDGNWSDVPLDGPLATLPVTGLKYSSDGKLFLSQGSKGPAGTPGQGIVRCLENGTWKTVTTLNSSIQAISFDRDDNLYLATADAGILCRSKSGQVKKLTGTANWPKNLIPVTVLKMNDVIIAGTDKGNVVVENSNSSKVIPL